jgi:hydroxymethylbilane synthase
VSNTPALRLGTRGSELALYQANRIKDSVGERLGRTCELVILKTQGDKDTSRPIAELSGVGVFVKRLERALLDGEVDLAVHSLKDLPTEMPDGLVVPCYPERVDPRDTLLVHFDAVDTAAGLIPLPQGSRVGTGSERRRAQLLALRPDLEIVPIRGNVPTRADMARSRTLDAVVLAAAGINRLELDLEGLARFDLPTELFVPAPGQGALAIQVRAADEAIRELLAALDDRDARETTAAERLLLHGIGAGCSVPLGAHAVREGDGLLLRSIYEVGHGSTTPTLRTALVRAETPEAVAALALRVLAPPPTAELPDLSGKTVLIAREHQRAAELQAAVAAAGGTARCRPPNRRETLVPDHEVCRALGGVGRGAWLLVASANAAAALGGALGASRSEPHELLAGLSVGAVGPGTARALAEAGVAVDLLPEVATGAGLAEAVLAATSAPGNAFLPAARDGRPELRDALQAAGWTVDVLELYATAAGEAASDDDLAVDAVVFASPKGALATLGEGRTVSAGTKLVAIGPTTAAELERLGHAPSAVAEEPTTAGLLAALACALA